MLNETKKLTKDSITQKSKSFKNLYSNKRLLVEIIFLFIF
jgi:hypothetical protein